MKQGNTILISFTGSAIQFISCQESSKSEKNKMLERHNQSDSTFKKIRWRYNSGSKEGKSFK